MKTFFTTGIILGIIACNNVQTNAASSNQAVPSEEPKGKLKTFRGAFSNGMKGDSLFFDMSPDGKKISNVTFKGYWRCSGKLERLTAAGPDGSYDVVNGLVDGHIAEPPNGGSTSWRFDLKASITDVKAMGTFRMNINNLGCDSYLLKFEAFPL